MIMTCHLPIKFENTVYLHRSRLYMTTLSGCCVLQLNYLQLPIAVWNSFKHPYLPEKVGRRCYKYQTPQSYLQLPQAWSVGWQNHTFFSSSHFFVFSRWCHCPS